MRHISPSAFVKSSSSDQAPYQASFHHSSIKNPPTYEVLPPSMVKRKVNAKTPVDTTSTMKVVSVPERCCQDRFDRFFAIAMISS